MNCIVMNIFSINLKGSLLTSLRNDYTSWMKATAPVLYPYIQCRNTFILKRRYPMKLTKKGVDYIKYKGKNYVYDLVENTNVSKKPDVEVVLKKYVQGFGNRGDVISIKRNVAYNNFLLTDLADYPTPEAIERLRSSSVKEGEDIVSYSSLSALQTVRFLDALVLSVIMNKDNDWVLQPWHIRVSFRKAGVCVPENCISLPEKPIEGPDEDLEMKEFYVTITINNTEKAFVRCHIHHWSTDPLNKLPFVSDFWKLKREPLFPEDAEKLNELRAHTESVLNKEFSYPDSEKSDNQ